MTDTPVVIITDSEGPSAIGRPAVHVVATTAAGTRSALERAKPLAAAFSACVVLIVPTVVSHGDLQESAADDARVHYRTIGKDLDLDLSIVGCMCCKLDDVFHGLLTSSSITVIGGRMHRWWPSAEQRLAQRLIAQGYPILFADTGDDSRYSATNR